jgi:hypothetical protein
MSFSGSLVSLGGSDVKLDCFFMCICCHVTLQILEICKLL